MEPEELNQKIFNSLYEAGFIALQTEMADFMNALESNGLCIVPINKPTSGYYDLMDRLAEEKDNPKDILGFKVYENPKMGERIIVVDTEKIKNSIGVSIQKSELPQRLGRGIAIASNYGTPPFAQVMKHMENNDVLLKDFEKIVGSNAITYHDIEQVIERMKRAPMRIHTDEMDFIAEIELLKKDIQVNNENLKPFKPGAKAWHNPTQKKSRNRESKRELTRKRKRKGK